MGEVERLQEQLGRVTGPAKQVVLGKLRAAEVRDRISWCQHCGLGKTRLRAVPWSGPTEGRAHLIVVGEAPGSDEDRQGVPFVGRSGQLLDRLLEEAGTSRRNVFVCNTLCCRPPKNRDPEPGELVACHPNFEAQLNLAGVHVGVALGGYAIANVLGLDRQSVTVGSYLMNPVWKDGRIWLGTYHPAYALRNPNAKKTIRETLQMGLALRWGEAVTPYPVWDQVEVMDKKGTEFGVELDRQGWVLVHSKLLGGQIVVTLNSETRVVNVPSTLTHLPSYTFDELLAVGLAGKGKRLGKEELQRIHMVKHEFGGTIMLTPH